MIAAASAPYITPMTHAPQARDIAPADSVAGTWVDRAPAWLRPWARLARADRPIGTWLLLFPCWWGLGLAGLAGGALPDWRHALLFAIGAFAMRSAGCAFNDIVDRDIDARVERTRNRPLAAGTIGVKGAFAFVVGLSLVGLAVLLSFDRWSILLGLASLAPVAVYPFMKRITHWPQAVLGVAFNWGALMGWSVATGGGLAPAAICLYLGGIAWTIGYDTIYAHQDRDDDSIVGVKSTALLFGRRTRAMVALFYAAALGLWGMAIWLAAPAPDAASAPATLWPAFAGLAAAAAHLGWQVAGLNPDDGADCLRRFRANVAVGWLLLAGLLATPLLAP